MEVNIYEKFKILFHKIFQEEYQVSRYYSEKLLTCLEDPNDYVGKHVLGSPAFSDLIFNSIGTIQKLSIHNKTFIIEVVTVLFKNELQFNKLQCQDFDMCLLRDCVVDNLNSEMPSGELHFAFIKLTTALVSHCSGMKLIISKKTWERVMYPGLHRKPAHVSKAIYEYLSKLVWRLDEYEEETTLYEVIVECRRAILNPIRQSEYQTLQVFDEEKEKFYSEPLLAPLQALLTIMSETSRLTQSKCFVPILKHCYFVEAATHKVMTGTRDPDIIYLIAHINFKFHLTVASKAGRSESDFLNDVIVCFVNAITILMTKKQMIAPIQEFVININIFWAKSGSKIYPSTFERNGQKYEIEDQFLYHLMLPTMTYLCDRER